MKDPKTQKIILLEIFMAILLIISIYSYMWFEMIQDDIENKDAVAQEAIDRSCYIPVMDKPVINLSITSVITEPVAVEEYIEPEITEEETMTETIEETTELINENFLYAQENYPEATKVFLAVYEFTGSRNAALGVIGNCMHECGLDTLHLYVDAYNKSENAYGICQWVYTYSKEVHGKNLDEQIEFLLGNIQYIFDYFGDRYGEHIVYQDFINAESPEIAALMFAKVYENCAKSQLSYQIRMNNAAVASFYYGGV